MAHEFTLSAFGLKLIKAYEGFRPVETTLVSGQRVIGYGHKFDVNEEPVTTQKKAEAVLMDDLAPYEALINDNIFAPLSQSQFDALVSLAFNIGPRAFLSSNVLHSLNNGRPLEAAAGFDEWRKSVIDGKHYVVDALVRRRTAEKALFLRPAEGAVPAPRHEVPAQSDPDYPRMSSAEFGAQDAKAIVEQTPYAAQPAQHRRREDGPAGILSLSEIDMVAQNQDTAAPQVRDDMPAASLSPIAQAAEEVSARLDRLMDPRTETSEGQQPKTKIETPAAEPLASANEFTETPQAANEGSHEDYQRLEKSVKAQTRSPDAYIQKSKPSVKTQTPTGFGAYFTALVVGFTLLVGGAMKWFMSPKGSLDQLSAFFAPVSTIVGAMVVLGALYYLLKALMRR